MWKLFVLCFIVESCSGLSKEFLYPHGRSGGVPDKALPPQDDVSSPELFLKTPIVFYNELYNSIFVNSNGILSFLTDFPHFYNIQFPLDYPSIAPLYTNVDIRASGAVYYRETQDEVILERGRKTIHDAFSGVKDFQPTSALVVTWEEVGYHKQGSDKVNTFQAAVFSDGEDSYVELLYPHNGIQWIQGTGTGSANGLPDARAQAGLIGGDGNMFTLRGSGTDQVRKLTEWSNVGNPGQWLFHIGKVPEDGHVQQPDLESQEDNTNVTPNSCLEGSYLCHSKSTCQDYEAGFCCFCQHGYFGNGYDCLKEDQHIRVNGQLSGSVNDVNVSLDLQSFVRTEEGRPYTALSKVPPLIGYDLQVLNVIGTSIGWLFAKPIKGALNGYQITGGILNQTIKVTFPQTGDQIIIRQRFLGLDVFDQLRMKGEIKGTVPIIRTGANITIKEYEEQYSWIGKGQILAHSSQTYDLDGLENHFNIEQQIDFKECSFVNLQLEKLRLKISRLFISYEVRENIVRYSTTNKITPIGVEEDPCREGNAQCGKHSVCIVEGDSYRCACNPGYHLLYPEGSSQGACIDVNECSTGTHNCDREATCFNNEGSFYCVCNPGFSGNGYQCAKDISCVDLQCDVHAECMLNARNEPVCVCRLGYHGNGTHCNLVDDGRVPPPPLQPPTPDRRPPQTVSCNELNRCHPNAQCIYDPRTDGFECLCNYGYRGDGYECARDDTAYPDFEEDECFSALDCGSEADCVLDVYKQIYECICKSGYVKDPVTRRCELYPIEPSPESGSGEVSEYACPVANDCHPNAMCIPHPEERDYSCHCVIGYEGDGRRVCRPLQVGCNVLNDCAVGTADCRYDQHAAGYRCKCRQGYQGDGHTCRPTLTCREDSSLCGEYATCVPTNTGLYSCQCLDGYIGDGKLCKKIPKRPANFLLVNQGMATIKIPYQPTSSNPGTPIQIQPFQQAIGIDIDCAEGRVYWSDINRHVIQSSNFTGGDAKKFVNTGIKSVEGLSVDWVSRNIYWTDSTLDQIVVASLDNSDIRKTLISDSLVNPRGIAVHPSKGKLFWADWNRAAPRIEWSNLDGSNRAVFIQGPSVHLPNSLAIDFNTDELCWADAGTKNIECIGIDNRYRRTVASNVSYPFGLAISQDHYYWSDWNTQKIERVTRPGQQPEKPLPVPRGGSGKLYGLVSVPENCFPLTNICAYSIGKCPENHLCLPNGLGERTCACAGTAEACNTIS